jgi:hypothetical protein
MSESSRKKLMYGILVAAVLFGVYNFMQPRKQAPGQTADAAGQVSAVNAGIGPAQGKTIDIAQKQSESWGRDPFRSGSTPSNSAPTPVAPRIAAVAAVPMPTWRLSGIIFNSKQPLALINGKLVGIGDQVDQARVSKIDQTKVTIIYNGTPIDLHVTKG